MLSVTSLSVSLTVTRPSRGDYTSDKAGVTIEAELDPGESVEEAVEMLQTMALEACRKGLDKAKEV